MSTEPDDDDEDESDDPEEVFVEREIAQNDPEGVQLLPDHAPRRDHQRRLVDVVADWLAQGKSYVEVTDLAIEATGCHTRTATRAIAAARKRWKAAGAEQLEDKRDRLRAMIEYTRAGAIAAGDFRAANNAERSLIEIEGLKAAHRLEISGTLGLRPVAALSPEERRAEIVALQAKQLAAGGAPAQETGDDPAAVPRKGRSRGN